MANAVMTRWAVLLALVIGVMSLSGLAHAAGKGTTGTFSFVNNTAKEIKVSTLSYNSCVTNRGESGFTVSPGTRFVVTIQKQPICPDETLRIRWNVTQRDMSNTMHVTTITYEEDGFKQPYPWTAKAYVSIDGDKLPKVDVFRIVCGEQYLACGQSVDSAITVNATQATIAAIPAPAVFFGESFGMKP